MKFYINFYINTDKAGIKIYNGDSVMCFNESTNECLKGFFVDSFSHRNNSNLAPAFIIYSGTSRNKHLSKLNTNDKNNGNDYIYLSDMEVIYPELLITSRNDGFSKSKIIHCRTVIFEKCVFDFEGKE